MDNKCMYANHFTVAAGETEAFLGFQLQIPIVKNDDHVESKEMVESITIAMSPSMLENMKNVLCNMLDNNGNDEKEQ